MRTKIGGRFFGKGGSETMLKMMIRSVGAVYIVVPRMVNWVPPSGSGIDYPRKFHGAFLPRSPRNFIARCTVRRTRPTNRIIVGCQFCKSDDTVDPCDAFLIQPFALFFSFLFCIKLPSFIIQISSKTLMKKFFFLNFAQFLITV